MITWNHIFPGNYTVKANVLAAMDREQNRRNAIFNSPVQRKQYLSQIKNAAWFETNAMSADSERESGAMMAADILNRIDRLLDEVMIDFEVY